MAKLHEMCGGAMHKQTMSHLKKHTDSHNTGFSCYKERYTNKQTSEEKKGKGGVTATSVAADGAFIVLLQQAGTSVGAQFARHSGSFRGHRMSQKSGRK